MAMFDLEKTAAMEKLLFISRDARDAAWLTSFYEAAPEASMATREQQIITGPDGFRYFALYIPPREQEFEAFCISHILNACLEKGVGIVIHPDKSPPEWVFTYGNLWSLHSYNSFDRMPAGGERRAPLASGRQVLLASPNETFLPGFARNILRAYLQKLGIANPRVMLVSDAAARLPQSLAFSFYPQDLPNQQTFDAVMERLKNWFLPPHYGLVGLPKEDEYEPHYVPL